MADGDVLQLDSSAPGGSGSIANETKFIFGPVPVPVIPFQVRPWPIFAGGTGIAGGVLIAQLIVLDREAELSALEVSIFATGANVKLALYTDNAELPGVLVAETADIPGTLGRFVSPVTSPGPVTIPAGSYWIALLASAGINMSATNVVSGKKAFVNGVTYGPFPDPFPTPDGIQTDCVMMAAHFNG